MQVVRGFESHRLRQRHDQICTLTCLFWLVYCLSYDSRDYSRSGKPEDRLMACFGGAETGLELKAVAAVGVIC